MQHTPGKAKAIGQRVYAADDLLDGQIDPRCIAVCQTEHGISLEEARANAERIANLWSAAA